MPDTRHTSQAKLNVTHQYINYYNDLNDGESNKAQDKYCPLNRKVTVIRYAGRWWHISGSNNFTMEIPFTGVYDGSGSNFIVSEAVWYAAKNGAGTYTAINEVFGGIRMTTAASSGNDNLFSDGDNTGTRFIWDSTNNLFMHFHLRLPWIGDTDNVYFLMGGWADADNYIAIRYDPNGVYFPADSNMFFITRSGGVEQYTSLGAPTQGKWHIFWLKANTKNVYCAMDDVLHGKHTANIPSTPLSCYGFIETQANEAKRLDIQHLLFNQYQRD